MQRSNAHPRHAYGLCRRELLRAGPLATAMLSTGPLYRPPLFPILHP